MYELKIYSRVIYYDNEKICKIGRRIDLSFQNWHKDFDECWPKHLKMSKFCTLIGYLWPKYIMFELKKCGRVMFDGTKYWCKIWRKTDFCFQISHGEVGKFSPEHLEVSKFELWWDSNHIMKNFQVKHRHYDILPQKICFWRLEIITRPLPCWQQDSLLLICPKIYP